MKDDRDKARFDLIPPQQLLDLARVFTVGAKKYTDEGWRTVENGRARYLAALHRHLNAWHRGEKIDPESGLPALAHVCANAMILGQLDVPEVAVVPAPLGAEGLGDLPDPVPGVGGSEGLKTGEAEVAGRGQTLEIWRMIARARSGTRDDGPGA